MTIISENYWNALEARSSFYKECDTDEAFDRYSVVIDAFALSGRQSSDFTQPANDLEVDVWLFSNVIAGGIIL